MNSWWKCTTRRATVPRRGTRASPSGMWIRTTRFELDETFQIFKIVCRIILFISQLNIGDFQESDGAIPAGDALSRYNGEKFSARNQRDVLRTSCMFKSNYHPGWWVESICYRFLEFITKIGCIVLSKLQDEWQLQEYHLLLLPSQHLRGLAVGSGPYQVAPVPPLGHIPRRETHPQKTRHEDKACRFWSWRWNTTTYVSRSNELEVISFISSY